VTPRRPATSSRSTRHHAAAARATALRARHQRHGRHGDRGQQLAQAQDDIEIATGRIYTDTDRLRCAGSLLAGQGRRPTGSVDRRAVRAGDAAGCHADPAGQVSTTLQSDGLVLAPMAARALKRVSWMRSRTVHVRSPIEGLGPDREHPRRRFRQRPVVDPHGRGRVMQAIATTRLDVLRGTTTDAYGDEQDTDTVVATGIPASLTEQSRRVTTKDDPTPRIIRYTTARVPGRHGHPRSGPGAGPVHRRPSMHRGRPLDHDQPGTRR
jgi:hypothetical protein